MASKIFLVVSILSCAFSFGVCDVKVPRNIIATHDVGGGKLKDTLDYSTPVFLMLSFNKEIVKRCGGARINPNWILTAAECLYGDRLGNASVDIVFAYPRLGSTYYVRNYDMRALETVIHHGYNPKTSSHNIAMLRAPVNQVSNVVKVAEPEDRVERYVDNIGSIFRWVNTTIKGSEYSVFSVDTFKAKVINSATCKKQYPYISEQHICALCENGNKLSQIDYGVPLVAPEGKEQRKTLIGIGSPGMAPSNLRVPAPMIYMRVSYYHQWIKSVSEK